MNTEMKNYLSMTAMVAIVLALIAVFWYVNAYSGSVVPQRTFAANGEGKVVAVPDVAEISFGLVTEGGLNLATLQQENAAKVNQMVAFLKESRIADEDIKTQSYYISPRYQYFDCSVRPLGPTGVSQPCPPPEIVGYSVSQSVLVKVRNLNDIGAILSGVVTRGANNVSGPNFTIDDPTELQNQAREEAVIKAREKAQAVARAAGFRLGKLVSVSEGSSYPPIYFRGLEAAGKGGDAGVPVPAIEPGSQEVRVSVTLVYEMR